MSIDVCIHPHCECLDYCEAIDPHSKSPVMSKKQEEIEKELEWYESDEWRIGRMGSNDK